MRPRSSPLYPAVTALLLILSLLPLMGVSAAGEPPLPVLISPADGSTMNTHLPLLQWTGADAETFKIVIKYPDGNKFFVRKIDAAQVCSGSDCGYSLASDNVSFDQNAEGYSWKVVAINTVGKSKSPSATFAIDAPGAPELEAPLDSATVTGDVTFLWNEITAANFYKIIVKNTVTKVKTKAELSFPTCDTGICEHSFASPFAVGTYHWKVVAQQTPLPNKSKSEKRFFIVE